MSSPSLEPNEPPCLVLQNKAQHRRSLHSLFLLVPCFPKGPCQAETAWSWQELAKEQGFVPALKIWHSNVDLYFHFKKKDTSIYIYIYGHPPQDLPISFFNGIYGVKCLFCKSKNDLFFVFVSKCSTQKHFKKNTLFFHIFLVCI